MSVEATSRRWPSSSGGNLTNTEGGPMDPLAYSSRSRSRPVVPECWSSTFTAATSAPATDSASAAVIQSGLIAPGESGNGSALLIGRAPFDQVGRPSGRRRLPGRHTNGPRSAYGQHMSQNPPTRVDEGWSEMSSIRSVESTTTTSGCTRNAHSDKDVAMGESTQFTIGVEAICTDGVGGELSQ